MQTAYEREKLYTAKKQKKYYTPTETVSLKSAGKNAEDKVARGGGLPCLPQIGVPKKNDMHTQGGLQ